MLAPGELPGEGVGIVASFQNLSPELRGDSFTLQLLQFATFCTIGLFLPYTCVTLIIFMPVVYLGGEIMALLLFVSFCTFSLFCLSVVCLPSCLPVYLWYVYSLV